MFFLHNRIDTLHEVAERLRALCPGVRFAEAHGQMDEGELEATMLEFLRGDADCLVATTIIESGLDIPQANTLIVERADQLGLAQAYQIRGRVGPLRASAPSPTCSTRREEALSAEAGARLATLSDHTELGSGFAIAMRDLELRGAGDLLGDEQSGHVAAVGFELYVALLDDAVEALRAEGGASGAEAAVRLDVDVDAYLPADYIPFEAAKIDVHRRIAGAREPGELRALRDELRDRFGPLPEPVENLLALQRARIELGAAGARRRSSGAAGSRSPRWSSTRRPSGAFASGSRRRCTSCARARCRCGSRASSWPGPVADRREERAFHLGVRVFQPRASAPARFPGPTGRICPSAMAEPRRTRGVGIFERLAKPCNRRLADQRQCIGDRADPALVATEGIQQPGDRVGSHLAQQECGVPRGPVILRDQELLEVGRHRREHARRPISRFTAASRTCSSGSRRVSLRIGRRASSGKSSFVSDRIAAVRTSGAESCECSRIDRRTSPSGEGISPGPRPPRANLDIPVRGRGNQRSGRLRADSPDATTASR